jgi:hypothetical protein
MSRQSQAEASAAKARAELEVVNLELTEMVAKEGDIKMQCKKQAETVSALRVYLNSEETLASVGDSVEVLGRLRVCS